MYVVALIGPIAAGKSSAASYLGEKGATIIDLDTISREVVEPGSPLLEQLARRFGDDLIDGSGALDRGLLARRAFATPEDTEDLDALMHPAILERFASFVLGGSCATTRGTIVVVQVPLLKVLDRMEHLVDVTLCVDADPRIRAQRAIARGLDPQDVENRMARQPEGSAYRDFADIVIVNDGGTEDLHRELDAWWESALEEARRG